MICFVIDNSLERHIVATSSFGQIVVLDDDMADRIIESSKTADNHPFGQGSSLFREATSEETSRWIKALSRKKDD
jgi:hypothetical protein